MAVGGGPFPNRGTLSFRSNVANALEVKNVLEYTVGVLDDIGVEYWLDYGTLLGAVRRGKFIRGDSDADIGIRSNYTVEVWEALKSHRKSNRYPIYGGFNGSGMQVWRKSRRAHVDIFFWTEGAGVMRRNWYIPGVDDRKGKDFPSDWIASLTPVTFEGRLYTAPSNPEQMCEHRYGSTWRTPLSNKEFNNQ